MIHFKKIAVMIDGGVTGKNRQDAVDTFQKNEKIKLIKDIAAAAVLIASIFTLVIAYFIFGKYM
jgi:hypothetical protein